MEIIQGRYDLLLVLLSFAISVFGSYTALQLARQLSPTGTERARPFVEGVWQGAGSALVMGLAVTGMHYTGMAAAVFRYSGQPQAFDPSALSPPTLAYEVFLVSLIILSIGLAVSISRRAARQEAGLEALG